MKRQAVLIKAFRQLRESHPESRPWELHLAGGLVTDASSDAYMTHLQSLAEDLPVVFHPNVPLAALKHLYQRASLFWHAAGFATENEPDEQEHFGMTTVEAMNHGCVPIVIGLGGQPEIVSDGIDGLLWMTPEDLVSRTFDLIESPERRLLLSRAAVDGGARFTTERFRRRVQDVILSS